MPRPAFQTSSTQLRFRVNKNHIRTCLHDVAKVQNQLIAKFLDGHGHAAVLNGSAIRAYRVRARRGAAQRALAAGLEHHRHVLAAYNRAGKIIRAAEYRTAAHIRTHDVPRADQIGFLRDGRGFRGIVIGRAGQHPVLAEQQSTRLTTVFKDGRQNAVFELEIQRLASRLNQARCLIVS